MSKPELPPIIILIMPYSLPEVFEGVHSVCVSKTHI